MKQHRIWRFLFWLYCAMMLWLLFDRTGHSEPKYNLIPFETIQLFWKLLSHPQFRRDAIVNLGGNVIMFLPLGFLLPKVFPKLEGIGKILLTTAAVITMVELTQLFTLLGSCDTDDLMLNVIGSAIGYGIHCIAKKRLS